MKMNIVLTTLENGVFIERIVGHTRVSMKTDFRQLVETLSEKQFGPKHHVRLDSTLFGFTGVDSIGNTIHLV